MIIRTIGNPPDQDIDKLMNAANKVLNKYSVGQYLLIRFCMPRTDYIENILKSKDEIQREFGYTFLLQKSTRTIKHPIAWETWPDVVCLCKVKKIEMAQKSGGTWEYPHFIVENVATQIEFDFAVADHMWSGHENETVLQMPFLVSAHLHYFDQGFLLQTKKREFHVDDQPFYEFAKLYKCTNEEAAEQLRNIKESKQKEIAEQSRAEKKKLEVTTSTLESLYKELQE